MKKKDIAKELGSSHTMSLKTKNLSGPLTYLNLIREVNTRLKSKAGRPSDVKRTKYHNIPLTPQTWKQLARIAKTIPSRRSVAPSQLACFLIEEGLNRLSKEMKEFKMEGIGSE